MQDLVRAGKIRHIGISNVTLPIIAPGILAAALLAFTLSIDEFIIAWFTAGAGRASTAATSRSPT